MLNIQSIVSGPLTTGWTHAGDVPGGRRRAGVALQTPLRLSARISLIISVVYRCLIAIKYVQQV